MHGAGVVRALTRDEYFHVNVDGTAHLLEAIETAAPTARLLLVSSLAARAPELSHYAASKHALEGFSESMAQEIGAFGIKLLLVEPGAVATKFISHGTREAARRMPEYSFISGTGKSGLEGYYASAASSPEEVVTAIFAALDSPEPPLRVIVGDDLRGTLHGKGEQLLQLADG